MGGVRGDRSLKNDVSPSSRDLRQGALPALLLSLHALRLRVSYRLLVVATTGNPA